MSEEASTSIVTTDETTVQEIPRYEMPNPFNYTEQQKSVRAKAIRDAIKDYPNVSPMWIEWIYDVIQNKDPEEVQRIMDNNEWDVPPEKQHDQGGVVKSLVIEDPTDEPTGGQFPELTQ